MSGGGMTERTAGTDLRRKIQSEIARAFAGKKESVDILILALLAELHVLIEDVPGVGKTTLAKCLAACCGMDFGRIQFTPDLLPGDIIGMNIWDPVKREFVFRPGGIMHELILADEINRATARTQAALLEAMEEKNVTVDGETISLPENFMVIATQNPAEFMGTFALPEAQVDRFGISMSLGYPGKNLENKILDMTGLENPIEEISPVTSPKEIRALQAQVRSVHGSEEIRNYILSIADQSRKNENLRLGISPRGAQNLFRGAKASAFMDGRDYIVPEDVLDIVGHVCRHRLLLSPGAGYSNMTQDTIIKDILSDIPVPTGIGRKGR